jgi:hypothetical protein
MKKIIKINEKEFRNMVDNMILEAPKDEEFRKALAWLDKTRSIKGDFYDKVFQLMFGFDPNALNKSSSRMDSFMKDLTRNDK